MKNVQSARPAKHNPGSNFHDHVDFGLTTIVDGDRMICFGTTAFNFRLLE
jgi:hypothetical protein